MIFSWFSLYFGTRDTLYSTFLGTTIVFFSFGLPLLDVIAGA